MLSAVFFYCFNYIFIFREICPYSVTALFKKLQGGSLVLFHEKGGELTDMKKLY